MNTEQLEQFINTLSEEQKLAFLQVLQAKETKPVHTQTQPEAPPSSTTVVGEDFRVVRGESDNRGRVPVRFRKNEWEDDGEEFMDVKTPRIERTSRNRDRAKKVEVECHVCGRSFQVNPKYVFGDYHRCNRCTRR